MCNRHCADAERPSRVSQLDLEAASLHSTLSSLASVEGESVTTSLDSHSVSSPSVDSGYGSTSGGKRRVSVSGLHATYDEGLAFLKAQQQQQQQNGGNAAFSPQSRASALSDSSPSSSPGSSPTRLPPVSESDSSLSLSDSTGAGVGGGRRATSILWLGSSCGNYTRQEAVEFLRNIDLREGDTMVIGIDACTDGPKIEKAYNDPQVRSPRASSVFFSQESLARVADGSSCRFHAQGVTRAFILEGVDVAGRTLGPESAKVLNQDNFEYVNRWNVQLGRHEVRSERLHCIRTVLGQRGRRC
jgi:hypothetical protein